MRFGIYELGDSFRFLASQGFESQYYFYFDDSCYRITSHKNGSIDFTKQSPKERGLRHFPSFYDFMKEEVAPGLTPGLNWIEVYDDRFMHPCGISSARSLSDIEKYFTFNNKRDWYDFIEKRYAEIKNEKELNKLHDLKINQYENRPNWVWALVGNVIGDHPFGKEKKIVNGTKRFKGGTKVYCLISGFGDGYESVPVIGRNRKGHLVQTIIREKYIENFRLKKVYSPTIIEMMYRGYRDDVAFGEDYWGRGWGNTDEDADSIKAMVKWLNLSEEQERRCDITGFMDQFALEMHFAKHPCLDFEARISLDTFTRANWRCDLINPLKCNPRLMKICPENYCRYDTCEKQMKYWAWCLSFKNSDKGAFDIIRTDEARERYGSVYPSNLTCSIGDCEPYLWDDYYGKINAEPKLFSWSLKISRGKCSYECSGVDDAPPVLKDMVRLLQVHGFNIDSHVIEILDLYRGS